MTKLMIGESEMFGWSLTDEEREVHAHLKPGQRVVYQLRGVR